VESERQRGEANIAVGRPKHHTKGAIALYMLCDVAPPPPEEDAREKKPETQKKRRVWLHRKNSRKLGALATFDPCAEIFPRPRE